MTKLLKTAFDAAAELSEDEQDAMARLVLAELDSEERWQRRFDASSEVLDRLAAEALAEDAANPPAGLRESSE